jgi:hypothetical protein
LGLTSLAHALETRIAQTFPLHASPNGVDGELRLLVDARLSDHQLSHLLDFALSGTPAFKRRPAVPAVLQIADADGNILQIEKLEKPLAHLRRYALRGGYEMFAVTVDYTAEAGSDSGPATIFFRVVAGKLRWIEAKDSSAGKLQRIVVADTGKQSWKIVTARASADIFDVSCHPAYPAEPGKWDGHTFAIDYKRYHFNGKDWLVSQKTKSGFWENEGEFPADSEFPAVGPGN